MMHEPKALKEIHEIREKIYEETKHMTPAERAAYAHSEAQKLIKEYNLKGSALSACGARHVFSG